MFREWFDRHLDDFEMVLEALRWVSIFFQFVTIILRAVCLEEGTVWYNAMIATWLILVLTWAFCWLFTLLILMYKVNK